MSYARTGRFYRCYGKRVLDLALVLPALIVLSPVMLLVALLIRIRLGRPILFRQQRPGPRGKPFTVAWEQKFALDPQSRWV